MTNFQVQSTLSTIAARIGVGVSDLTFRIHFADGTRLQPSDFALSVQTQAGGAIALTGICDRVSVLWEFVPDQDGYWVSLEVQNQSRKPVSSLSGLIVTYRPQRDEQTCRIPTLPLGVEGVGMPRLDELNSENRAGSLLRGAFLSSIEPGVFLGTRLPQRHIHLYTVEQTGALLRFDCTTHFIEGPGRETNLSSEATWICARRNIGSALDAYAAHLPLCLPIAPPVGWNSWDYYFSAVSLDDLIENLEALRQDPILAAHIRYIVVDMGWYHTEGEWYPNYRFPGGLEQMADEIRQRGFIPGIWTAPVAINKLSRTALRSPELLIKDEHGDPATSPSSAGWFMLDPTHPLGREFLAGLYTRLYRAGFRFFKVDYVSDLLSAQRFYDPTQGPYDALRTLFGLIRTCVTQESHILGCSLPEECGPGVADSGRIGIDIHNHWSHVEWVADYMQLKYWQHHRVWVNDPDFLVVRGLDTSLEAETNVLNPTAHHPNPPRWRRGPVFTLDEARTWATLVRLSGGSVFLGDRLAMLNPAGMALIKPLLEPTGVAARPLDLGNAPRPSLWLAQGAETCLGVINWSEAPRTQVIDWAALGLDAPSFVRDFWSGETLTVDQGRLGVCLAPHASALLCWQ